MPHRLVVRHDPAEPFKPRILLNDVDITDQTVEATVTVSRYSETIVLLRLRPVDIDIEGTVTAH